MKFAEILNLSVEEINAQIEELRKDLFDARFQKATHQLEDTAVFGRKRHQIAQLATALRQKELQTQGEKVHA